MREPIIYLRAPVFPSVAKVDPGAMSVRAERMAILADMARSGLRSEIQAVADPYQLAVYLLTPTSLRGESLREMMDSRCRLTKACERRTSLIIAGQ
jgi:hypothetical protein